MIGQLFAAVFGGLREAGRLAQAGQFIPTRMILKRISATLRHGFVLLAVRLEVKPRRLGVAAPLHAKRDDDRAASPCFPLWSSVSLSSRHLRFGNAESTELGL